MSLLQRFLYLYEWIRRELAGGEFTRWDEDRLWRGAERARAGAEEVLERLCDLDADRQPYLEAAACALKARPRVRVTQIVVEVALAASAVASTGNPYITITPASIPSE